MNKEGIQMPKFLVTYKKRGFPFGTHAGFELIEAPRLTVAWKETIGILETLRKDGDVILEIRRIEEVDADTKPSDIKTTAQREMIFAHEEKIAKPNSKKSSDC